MISVLNQYITVRIAGIAERTYKSRGRKQVFMLNLLLVLCLLPMLTRAAEPLTLEQAFEIAYQNNPELLAAQQNLEIARGRLVKGRYLNQFNPALRGRGFNRDFAQGGSGGQYQLYLSQEVEIAGQRGLRIEEAQRNLKKVEAIVQDQERILRGAVRRAFYTALFAGERYTLLQKVEELTRRVRDAASARFRAGVAPIMEANLAEIRYGQSRKETLEAEAIAQSARVTLQRVLGVPQDQSIQLAGELKGVPQNFETSDLLGLALKQRPDLAATTREIERIKAEKVLTNRLIIPNPTFEAIYQTERENVFGGADTMMGGGLRIPLPVFDRKQAELVTLAGQENKEWHLLQGTQRSIEQEVAKAFQDYQATRRSMEVFEADVLEKVEENFQFIEIAYREGKIGLLQLIVVQDHLIKAQLSYVGSLGQFRMAEANLEQALGGRI
jgi:cobalt-zinc-cadmium efflux system outer membrane protein